MRRSIEILANTGSTMNTTGVKVKADSYYGYTDGIHSVSIKYTNFVGTVKLQATLSLNPAEADWGDIKTITKATSVTSTEIHTFKGNYVYLRAVVDRSAVGNGVDYLAAYGAISQISLSN
jgi:hypothetical protein|tara:strand:+ start:1780 stop:2139 length:360 start_codon:yes stop_codon:yes gene_type:complete